MALIYSSTGSASPVHQVVHILGESNGEAQFIDTQSIVATEDILTEVTDDSSLDSGKVVGPQALRKYYESHQSSGPQGERGYQGYQGSPGVGSMGPRGYQGLQGAPGEGGTGSDYWKTTAVGYQGTQNLYADYHVYAIDFYQGSDDRIKTKLEDIKGALDKILSIPTFKFKFNGSERVHLGTSAQSVNDLVPEVISTQPNRLLAVNYPELSVYTLAALKELVVLLKDKNII